jgi:hypothetical protein
MKSPTKKERRNKVVSAVAIAIVFRTDRLRRVAGREIKGKSAAFL